MGPSAVGGGMPAVPRRVCSAVASGRSRMDRRPIYRAVVALFCEPAHTRRQTKPWRAACRHGVRLSPTCRASRTIPASRQPGFPGAWRADDRFLRLQPAASSRRTQTSSSAGTSWSTLGPSTEEMDDAQEPGGASSTELASECLASARVSGRPYPACPATPSAPKG
jgi:hypothetical protein